MSAASNACKVGLSEVTGQAIYPVCTELQSEDYRISMSGIRAEGVGGAGVRCVGGSRSG